MALAISFPDQCDVDQPLVRVCDLAAIGGARDGDGDGSSFAEGCITLSGGVDLPLLTISGADDATAPLGYGPGRTLGDCDAEKSLLAARARKGSGRDDQAAVVGHGGERVDGIKNNSCERQRRDEQARERKNNGLGCEAAPMVFDLLSEQGQRT